MTQRIFDVENEKDMADLWNILPNGIKKISPNYSYNETSLYADVNFIRIPIGLIKINWHDKTEIIRPMQEATEADIGKWCCFWDNCHEDIIIGKLTVVERNKGHTYYRLGNYAVLDHCHRLTKQEIEELC